MSREIDRQFDCLFIRAALIPIHGAERKLETVTHHSFAAVETETLPTFLAAPRGSAIGYETDDAVS
jgi:hypothetical protein